MLTEDAKVTSGGRDRSAEARAFTTLAARANAARRQGASLQSGEAVYREVSRPMRRLVAMR